jgi:hypothetical protein
MWAAENGHTEVVRKLELIEAGADFNAKEKVRQVDRKSKMDKVIEPGTDTMSVEEKVRMFGTGFPIYLACSKHCSCYLCHWPADDCARNTPHSGPDGSLLVLQEVSIADDSIMLIATGTD